MEHKKAPPATFPYLIVALIVSCLVFFARWRNHSDLLTRPSSATRWYIYVINWFQDPHTMANLHKRLAFLTTFLSRLASIIALDNGLAITPQMGWNTWNHFGCSINEDLILSAAQSVVTNALNKLGYGCNVRSPCFVFSSWSTSAQISLWMIVSLLSISGREKR